MSDPYSPPSTRPARIDMPFKFKWLDGEGNETGFFSKKGHFDGQTVTIDDLDLPIEAVFRATQRFNRLILVVPAEGGGFTSIALAITKGGAGEIARELNRESSRRWANMQREALEKEGRGETYSEAHCPRCEAVVVTSGFERTRQLYCDYCDSITTLDANRPRGEEKLRVCDECGYYANPQGFTTFYFYFLLVVYGYSSSKRYMCHSCMRGEAWKMLGINFIFVLGVPFAIVQLIRAYTGGKVSMPDYPRLDEANALAKKGRYRDANQLYEAICQGQRAAAGVRFNQALCHVNAGDTKGAEAPLEAALADCSNYQPAASLLLDVYSRLGREKRLLALQEKWGAAPEE